MNIKIPIHEIKIDDVTIPIELNYHTGGIKATDISGSVGLGWSLNAGGGIYRTINNMADEEYSSSHHTFLSPIINLEEFISGNVQTLNKQAELQSISVGTTDLNPDNYSYNFLNFSGGLYFDNNKVLKNENSEPFDFVYSSRKLENFTVYDDIGSTYFFKDHEYTSFAFSSTYKSSWKLSEIITNKNNKVNFEYLEYNSSHLIASHSFLYKIKIETEQGPYLCFNDKEEFQNVYSQTNAGNKLISKIESDDQIIIFKYSDDLNAADWHRKLDFIEIFNRDNELVKKIGLKYKIAQGDKRLLLSEVIFHSINDNLEQKYFLEYNEDSRSRDTRTLNKDLFGYFNNSNNTTLLRLSTTPIGPGHPLAQISASYYNANREPYIEGAKINSLKKFVYPSGGSMNLNYSLNSENSKYAPGLRISKIQLLDSDNSEQKTTNYIYSDLFGNINTPHDVIINNIPVNTYLWQSVQCFNYNSENRMQDQYLPANFYYKKVIIEEKFQDNIQTIVEYYNEPNLETEDDALNGYVLKPQLINKEFYKGNINPNNLVKRENYDFETIYINAIPIFNYKLLSSYYSNETISGNIHACFTFYPGIVKTKFQRPKWFRLKHQEEEYFTDSGSANIAKRKKNYYNIFYNKYINKTEFTDSKGDTAIHSFKFIWDLINENINPFGIYSDMSSKRFQKYPIISTITKNNSIQIHQNEFKKDNDYGWYNIANIKYFNNNILSSEEAFSKYDRYGNIISYNQNNNPTRIIIWGYNGKYPVIIIDNVQYDNILSIIDQNAIDRLNSSNVSSTLVDLEINRIASTLRTSLPQCQIISSTYKPLIGITSKTDARGITEYYRYDGFGRLSTILDHESNILKTFCYNYLNQKIDCTTYIVTKDFSNISKSGTFAKNNCGAGFQGTSVTYTVPAGRYTSSISQADADQKAINDVNTNGQTYANTNGGCNVIICKKVEILIPLTLYNSLYVNYKDCISLNTKVEPLSFYDHDYNPDASGRVKVYLCVEGSENFIGLRDSYNGSNKSFANTAINWIGNCN